MIVSRGWKKSSSGAIKLTTLIALFIAVPLSILSFNSGYADGWLPPPSQDIPSNFSSRAGNVIENEPDGPNDLRVGGIANTRHNLTMSYSERSTVMDTYRNDYFEICVYCHTPHGANSTAAAPLWNRTVAQRSYVMYNQDKSTGSTTFYEPSAQDLNYTQPGPNSLTCLSCHDGATAIDSVINMPTQLTGAFRAGYNKGQETGVNPEFLDAWSGNLLALEGLSLETPQIVAGSPGDPDKIDASHASLSNQGSGYCLSCHAPNQGNQGGTFNPQNFDIFVIGDQYNTSGSSVNYLADDHPIGVEYPTEFGPDVDFREPDVKKAKMAFFDDNGNNRADPNEVRLYDTGDGYEVECGSCHDPHGIKVNDDNSNELIPSFLRVGDFDTRVSRAPGLSDARSQVSGNAGSQLCLTCHVK